MEALVSVRPRFVHRCVRKASDEHFACKIIDCQLIEERCYMMQQFQTEIEALYASSNIQESFGLRRIYHSRENLSWSFKEGGELFDYVKSERSRKKKSQDCPYG
jgi:hypothetical protein